MKCAPGCGIMKIIQRFSPRRAEKEQRMKPYDLLIVGAGLFGAVVAQQARERGLRCLVVERRDHVAGNAFTQEVEGIQVHRYGAHIFHTSDEAVWAYVSR